MSTADRYGIAVYEGVTRNTGLDSDRPRALMSVGDVSRWAGVSRPTAAKYLMQFVKANVIATFQVGNRWVYQYIGDGKDI